MMWDYARRIRFLILAGDIEKQVEYLSKAMIASLCACGFGSAMQLDAGHQTLSTDKEKLCQPIHRTTTISRTQNFLSFSTSG